MHQLLRNYMLAKMAGTIAMYKATRAIVHPGMKGSAREALCAGIIAPWFGPSVKIGTGIVIDKDGNSSLQTDNIIYWPDIQPATFLGGDEGPCLFPIEGVAAVVEVKSKLATDQLFGIFNNLKSSCRALKLTSGAHMDTEGHRIAHPIILPLACVLAFDTEVAIATLAESLKENQDHWNFACILGGNGGLFVNHRNGKITNCGLATDAERLLGFSVILRDNIQDIRRHRGTPALEKYVVSFNHQEI